jgi:hypothetical protein
MNRSNNECRKAHLPAEKLCDAELDAVTGGGMMELMGQMLTNLANMRHEMLKGIAQNLRG